VAYEHDGPFAASGLLFRIGKAFTGYAVCLREVEKGTDAKYGPWERPVLQLFRMDRDGWKLLQESKVMGCRSGLLRHLKVACHGAEIFVYYEDMETPVLKEFDERYDRAGGGGIYKDPLGAGTFDNFVISSGGATQVEAESARLYRALQDAMDREIQDVGFMPGAETSLGQISQRSGRTLLSALLKRTAAFHGMPLSI
jgi:hypothetical protein